MSKTTKHTPGPWTMETVQTSCGIYHKIGPFPDDRERRQNWACVYVDNSSSSHDAELKSNAILIAAAPELLEALVAIRALAGYENLTDADLASHPSEFAQVERIARAAIAKATGQEDAS